MKNYNTDKPLPKGKLPKYFGIFPYIIIRIYPTIYKPYPIIFHDRKIEEKQFLRAKCFEDKKMTLNKLIILNIKISHVYKKDSCLINDSNECYYYKNGEIIRKSQPPSGGILLINDNLISCIGYKHHY